MQREGGANAGTDALQAYLRAIAALPRLAPERERELGRRILHEHETAFRMHASLGQEQASGDEVGRRQGTTEAAAEGEQGVGRLRTSEDVGTEGARTRPSKGGPRRDELQEGNMLDASTSENLSPELLKVAERAKREPGAKFHSLAHLIDVAALRRAYAIGSARMRSWVWMA